MRLQPPARVRTTLLRQPLAEQAHHHRQKLRTMRVVGQGDPNLLCLIHPHTWTMVMNTEDGNMSILFDVYKRRKKPPGHIKEQLTVK